MDLDLDYENDFNLKETELRLGLPGSDHEPTTPRIRNNKRILYSEESRCSDSGLTDDGIDAPPAK